MGYVKRRKDDNDRRIIRVELTAKGNRVCKVHRDFHEEMVSRVCEDSHVLDDELLIKSLQQYCISLKISKKNIRRLYEWIKNIINWLLCTTKST